MIETKGSLSSMVSPTSIRRNRRPGTEFLCHHSCLFHSNSRTNISHPDHIVLARRMPTSGRLQGRILD